MPTVAILQMSRAHFPQNKRRTFRGFLASGKSPGFETEGISDLGNFLETPNNLLGVEYCKALIRQKSPIQPITLFYEREMDTQPGSYRRTCLASAIRRNLKEELIFPFFFIAGA